MDKVEQDTSKEVVEGAVVHMKMELTSQMSPVTLKIQSGPHYQTIQGKLSLRTRYEKNPWQIKIGAPQSLPLLDNNTITG